MRRAILAYTSLHQRRVRAPWRGGVQTVQIEAFSAADSRKRRGRLRQEPQIRQIRQSAKSFLQLSLNSPILQAVKKAAGHYVILEGHCAGAKLCPLSRVEAGTVVCVKELSAA